MFFKIHKCVKSFNRNHILCRLKMVGSGIFFDQCTNNFERKHNHECWNHAQEVRLAMEASQIKHVRHRNTARHDEGYQTLE